MKKPSLTPLLALLLAFCSNTIPVTAQWASFSAGNTNGFIVEFAEHEGSLYATGLFSRIGGVQANYIARWNGAAWEPVGGGLPDEGHSMLSFGGALHVAKYEWAADSNYLFRWNSSISTWSRLGNGFYLTTGVPGFTSQTPSLYALAEYDGQLLVAGEFDRIGADTISGIAAWNGVKWEPLGKGFSGYIEGGPPIMYPHSMAVQDGWLYVAGNFKTAGEVEANGIARWNGSVWEAVGTGFNGAVYGITFHNGELYAGGAFTRSGENELGYVAKWDGAEWVNPGVSVDYATIPPYPFVHTLRSINGQLYVLGGFDQCTGANGMDIPCGGILAFDGETWDGLDGGLSGEAEAIIPYEGGILVGGFFNRAGGVTVNNMALWGVVSSAEEDIAGSPSVEVFPNPVREAFFLQLPEGVFECAYILYDAMGRPVRRGRYSGREAISADGLAPGLYGLEVRTGTGVAMKKVMVGKAE
ncbi:MAG: T9SS type A sorting domain-containing protein [Lewinellaceae bacterium]|nr:T9SS type A sorting domain-containing protein [Lewinellaceae bacterium]